MRHVNVIIDEIHVQTLLSEEKKKMGLIDMLSIKFYASSTHPKQPRRLIVQVDKMQ